MPAKKEISNHPLEMLELYDKLITAVPGVERKGATLPYTSLNGNMFSYIDKSGALGLRLPEGLREEFLGKYNTTLLVAFGMVMKEYVVVPEKVLKNTKALTPYFVSSYEYAKTLKPKPSKKK
jgi:hypothetical protein